MVEGIFVTLDHKAHDAVVQLCHRLPRIIADKRNQIGGLKIELVERDLLDDARSGSRLAKRDPAGHLFQRWQHLG